jgi:5'-nucleotidase
MIQAVLFDLDDTLFDHLYSSRCGLAALHRHYLCLQQESLDELDRLHMDLLELYHGEVLQGVRTLESARRERFRQLFACYGERFDDVQADIAAESYREVFLNNRQLVPGARQLLIRLRADVRIGIVTNNMLGEQTAKLAHLGLTDLIDALITSEEVGVAKPAAGIFAAALDHLRCVPTEAVMVGDSWQADILGATRVGMRAVWLNRLGVTCPDPTLAQEILSFEPTDEVAHLILDGNTSARIKG